MTQRRVKTNRAYIERFDRAQEFTEEEKGRKEKRRKGRFEGEVAGRCNPVRGYHLYQRGESVEVLSGGGTGIRAERTRETARLIYNAKWISRGGGNDRPRWARLILDL